MNKKKLLLIVLPIAILSSVMLFAFRKKADPVAKNKLLSELLYAGLKQLHFNMKEVDDEYSKNSFSLYLNSIDNTKRFLLQSDVEQLRKYEQKMDDEFLSGDSKMLDETVNILEKRISQSEDIVMSILDKPFNFKKKESYQLDPEKRSFAKNKSELKESWRKALKYQALIRYENSLETQEAKAKEAKTKGEEFEPKTNKELEEAAREQLVKTYKNTFDFFEKRDRDDRAAEYFNAMMSVADPHTSYFPPEDKDNFDIRMSGKLEGIGAQLQQADGVIKVSRIVPGSASWKQKQLKEEDVILKVGQADAEPVDVTAMPLKDAVQLIRGQKGTEVRLTVRKPDGVIMVIPIIRDVVILEENFAKSAVIQTEEGKKVGYIKLPSFYADFSRSGGRNSGKDVRLELEKLKKQGVEGMILDLRFNGGGSLADAIEMTGLFIEDGPVVQVKAKNTEKKVYRDEDKSVTWDGDLVVLVNRYSASASEILAGALQDYERAVIVGTPTTYGKGTVQRFIDLDRMVRGSEDMKPLGSLKLTIQKFYRITGASTQWKGVESDIVLPDMYSFMDGEKDAKFALPWDEIDDVKFDDWDDEPKIKKLREKSAKRVSNSEVFSMIEKNAQRLKEQREKTEVSLNYEAYRAEQDRLQAEAKKFENISVSNEGWKVVPTKSNVKNEAMNKNRETLNEDWKKEIKKDEVIDEAIHILMDMD